MTFEEAKQFAEENGKYNFMLCNCSADDFRFPLSNKTLCLWIFVCLQVFSIVKQVRKREYAFCIQMVFFRIEEHLHSLLKRPLSILAGR